MVNHGRKAMRLSEFPGTALSALGMTYGQFGGQNYSYGELGYNGSYSVESIHKAAEDQEDIAYGIHDMGIHGNENQ